LGSCCLFLWVRLFGKRNICWFRLAIRGRSIEFVQVLIVSADEAGALFKFVGICRRGSSDEGFVELTWDHLLQSRYINFVGDVLFIELRQFQVDPFPCLVELAFGGENQDFVFNRRTFDTEAPWLLKDFVVECCCVYVGISFGRVQNIQRGMLEITDRYGCNVVDVGIVLAK